MVLGQNVRWLRTRSGLSQQELASRVRLRRHKTTASYISRVERGQIDPPVSFVLSLARALRCRPWFLLADIQDALGFWEAYLSLSPSRKREVQSFIRHLSNRSW